MSTMETDQYEYRKMHKKFKPELDTSQDDFRSIAMSRDSSKRQHIRMLRQSSEGKSGIHTLIEKYLSKPSGVVGQTLDDGMTLRKSKSKTNISSSQTSIHKPKWKSSQHNVNKDPYSSAEDLRSVTTTRSMTASKKDVMSDVNSVLSVSDVRPSAPGPGMTRSATMVAYPVIVRENTQSEINSVFHDEFFDFLNIPGHFNTRGIFGQKASVQETAPKLYRANTDIMTIGAVHRETSKDIRSSLPNVIMKTQQNLQKKIKPKATVVFPQLAKPRPPYHTKSKNHNTHKGDKVKTKGLHALSSDLNSVELSKNRSASLTASLTSLPVKRGIDVSTQTDPIEDEEILEITYSVKKENT